MSENYFEKYKSTLLSMPLSNAWNGYGSAIFLEFGSLSLVKKNGEKRNNARGDITIMIEWDWRAEKELSIICGSSVESDKIESFLSTLVGSKMTELTTTGKLPELEIKLSNGITLKSFMTDIGQPEWAFFDHRKNSFPTLAVEDGLISLQE